MKHVLSTISLEDIRTHIANLEAMDRSSVSVDELKETISRLMNGYTSLTTKISANYAWRARQNIDGARFNNIRELWYPPANILSCFGRLNRPHNPLMYLTAAHTNASLELRPKVGDISTVLRVRLKDNEIVPHVMELGFLEASRDSSAKNRLPSLNASFHAKQFMEGQEEKNDLIRCFLSREFTRIVPRGEETSFKVTVAIAEILMSSNRIDGIIYPSMAGDDSGSSPGMNLGLKPESADRLFVADLCWMERIVKKIDEGYLVQCIAASKEIEPSGEIVWS